jgi:hypothetical protein
MNELITIRAFSNSVDFEMAKAYLESLGISCYAKDEIVNRAYVANVNGGAKLMVNEEQAEEATKLLIEGGYLKEEDFEPTPEFKWAEKIISYFQKSK